MDPRHVANIDREMIDIDESTSHTDQTKRRAHILFLTRWSGGDETWESWNHVRRTETSHKYLEPNGMKQLTPREICMG